MLKAKHDFTTIFDKPNKKIFMLKAKHDFTTIFDKPNKKIFLSFKYLFYNFMRPISLSIIVFSLIIPLMIYSHTKSDKNNIVKKQLYINILQEKIVDVITEKNKNTDKLKDIKLLKLLEFQLEMQLANTENKIDITSKEKENINLMTKQEDQLYREIFLTK